MFISPIPGEDGAKRGRVATNCNKAPKRYATVVDVTSVGSYGVRILKKHAAHQNINPALKNLSLKTIHFISV